MYYSYGGFGSIVNYLVQMGLMDSIIPFFLVFTLVFATLQKVKVFGEIKNYKTYNVIIALSMAFAVVVPHLTGYYYYGNIMGQVDIVNIINGALPHVALIMIAVIMLFILLGVWVGPTDISKSNFLSGFAVIFSMAAIVVIFLASAGVFGNGWPRWLFFLSDPQTRSLFLAALVFGLVVYFIVREPTDPTKKENAGKGWKKMMEEIGASAKK